MAAFRSALEKEGKEEKREEGRGKKEKRESRGWRERRGARL